MPKPEHIVQTKWTDPATGIVWIASNPTKNFTEEEMKKYAKDFTHLLAIGTLTIPGNTIVFAAP